MGILSIGTSSTAERLRRPFSKFYDDPANIARYEPTPVCVVRRMLELGGAGADDVVYDLGCGDGRILFTAVEEFGVRRAVGYELNPTIYEAVRRKMDRKGLRGRVEVVNGNFFLADLSPASLVTIYLTTLVNRKLRPKFEEELRGGARVVSHDFPVRGWTTTKPDYPDYYTVGLHKVYLYRVPDAYGEARSRRGILRNKIPWRGMLKALRLR